MGLEEQKTIGKLCVPGKSFSSVSEVGREGRQSGRDEVRKGQMGSDGVMESHTEGPQWHAGKSTGQFTGHRADSGERARGESSLSMEMAGLAFLDCLHSGRSTLLGALEPKAGDLGLK